jgi:hypothetical protein
MQTLYNVGHQTFIVGNTRRIVDGWDRVSQRVDSVGGVNEGAHSNRKRTLIPMQSGQ